MSTPLDEPRRRSEQRAGGDSDRGRLALRIDVEDSRLALSHDAQGGKSHAEGHERERLTEHPMLPGASVPRNQESSHGAGAAT
ncbi:hypothetical protein [Sorangium sp. So ce394]|uniref:hypothetical protein n=1 Tax=Sorangium sp. So ce394 TaxID=3133310 RepID=UPI003F5C16E1